MFRLSLFMDNDVTGIVLSKEEAGKLQLLNAALRVSSRSTYTS